MNTVRIMMDLLALLKIRKTPESNAARLKLVVQLLHKFTDDLVN